MRIVCPACSAAYEVPDSLMIPGRGVRCARCGDEWVPVTPEPPPLPPPPSLPPPEAPAQPPWPDAELAQEVEVEPLGQPGPGSPRFTAMDRLALHRSSAGVSTAPLRIAWAATALLLVLLIAAAYVWRAELMRVWPASQRVYHALGLMQNIPGKP